MKTTSYTIVTHSSGKRKVYRTERYLLIKRLKFAGILILAAVVTLLFCGMAITEDRPYMPVQMVFFSGIGLMVLASLVYSYLGYKEPFDGEKGNNNKKSHYRRKTR